MAKSTERAYIEFIWKADRKYVNLGEDETFSFADVVEFLRGSELASRFDFERYDQDLLSPQQKSRHPSLFSKGLKASSPQGKYHFPHYYETRIELCWFDRKIPKGKRKPTLPKIWISYFYTSYRTIPHFLATLLEAFPQIDAVQEKISVAEREMLRLKRVQDLVNVSIPDLLRETFRGSGFKYFYKQGADFLELNVKLPYKQKVKFVIKYDQLDKKLPVLMNQLQALHDIMKKYGRAMVTGYGTETWIDSEP